MQADKSEYIQFTCLDGVGQRKRRPHVGGRAKGQVRLGVL